MASPITSFLFGFDHTEGIVAVEFAPPNVAVVFIRQSDGATKATHERFRCSPGTPGVLKTRYFPDWRSLPRGKRASRRSDRLLASRERMVWEACPAVS